MVKFRDFRDVIREDLKEIEKEKKRKDILEIFEKKKTRLVKIAPHKKHPKPIPKTLTHPKS